MESRENNGHDNTGGRRIPDGHGMAFVSTTSDWKSMAEVKVTHVHPVVRTGVGDITPFKAGETRKDSNTSED